MRGGASRTCVLLHISCSRPEAIRNVQHLSELSGGVSRSQICGSSLLGLLSKRSMGGDIVRRGGRCVGWALAGPEVILGRLAKKLASFVESS